MNKKYKDGTTAEQIMLDGWSRNFNITQTFNELLAQGFDMPKLHILQKWQEYQKQYEKDMGIERIVDPCPNRRYDAVYQDGVEWLNGESDEQKD